MPVSGPHLPSRKVSRTPVRRKEKLARKIVSHPENWAKKVAKTNRDKGLAYISQGSKKEIALKKLLVTDDVLLTTDDTQS